MLDVLLDALIDSVKVFIVVFAVYIILSFFEVKIANKLSKKSKLSPFFGALFGLVPQCGISVVASDLYLKRHITMGTLIAVFLACSDEALPIMLASGNQKALMVIPLILVKFVVGFCAGFIIDMFVSRDKECVEKHLEECEHVEEIHTGCCHHHIDNEKQSKWDEHFWHPLVHSLKLCAYVLVINIIFGLIIYFVKEENIISFLQVNKFFAPLIATLIGLIPNCASSVILAELYVLGGISFGACLAGLCMNAGLGLIFLFKNKENLKNNFKILGILAGISILIGYVTCLICGF